MIPKLMCTQHPDSTVKVTVNEEVDEALVSFIGFGCDEVMVDYEGKATPYGQPKDIVLKSISLNLKLGERYFITPRLPNPTLEDFDRAMLALEAALLANYFSIRYVGTQAVRWVIIPMVEDIGTITLIKRMLKRKIEIYREETGLRELEDIDVIPLLENIDAQLDIDKYVIEASKEASGRGIRIFLGKSDAAVKHGHIASSLSIIYALMRVKQLERELGVRIHIILGMGTPPFRGGLNNPGLVHLEVIQYSGYYTATIQSAVRYDMSFDDYRKVRNTILSACCLPPRNIDLDITEIIHEASKSYKEVVLRYINVINEVAKVIPSTRDRVSWTVYGRKMETSNGSFSMPRAIVYTATWYAMGLPPIFLDAPFIVKLAKEDRLDDLLKALPALKSEWEFDSEFFDPQTAVVYLGESLVNVVKEAMDYLGITPRTNATYTALLRMPRNEPNVIALGKFRKFLG